MKFEVRFGDNFVGQYQTEHDAREAYDALPLDDVAQIWCDDRCIATRQSSDQNLNLRRA